jgi:site-specific DNA-methyltransferase (adenine-specific)
VARRRAEQNGGTDRDDWCTPDVVLDVARRVAGGRIAYDPCGNPESRVGALSETRLPRYEEPDKVYPEWISFGDGLEKPFPLDGLTFVNPPYGFERIEGGKRGLNRNLLWAEKAAEEALRGAESLWLVPSAPGCKWWQVYWLADVLCFIDGRLRFVGAEQGADFESAIAYFGPDAERAASAMVEIGKVVLGRDVRW